MNVPQLTQSPSLGVKIPDLLLTFSNCWTVCRWIFPRWRVFGIVTGGQQWDFVPEREDLGWWETVLLWQLQRGHSLRGTCGRAGSDSAHPAAGGQWDCGSDLLPEGNNQALRCQGPVQALRSPFHRQRAPCDTPFCWGHSSVVLPRGAGGAAPERSGVQLQGVPPTPILVRCTNLPCFFRVLN